MRRAASAHLRLEALLHNAQVVRRHAPISRVLAVIKAEGYGHGMQRVAEVLATAVDAFAVSHMEEAEVLRAAGHDKPLVVLHGCQTREHWQQAFALGLSPVIHHLSQLEVLETLPMRARLPLWVKMDSGMTRLGFAPEEIAAVCERLKASGRCAETPVVMSHFACADEPQRPENTQQLQCFLDATAPLQVSLSMANSGALLAQPETRLDWVRPGIMLYGASPLLGQTGLDWDLKPVMTLKAPIISIEDREQGAAVGYGSITTLQRPSRIAVVAIGYADGYPRHAPPGTPVWLHGQRVSLMGRVSMDLVCVDVTDVPAAQLGDEVTLWGEGLPVEEIAHAAGTISYDLLCGVADRVQIKAQ